MGIQIDIVHFGIYLPLFGFVEESGSTQGDIRFVQLRLRSNTCIIRTVDGRKDRRPFYILLEADTFIKRSTGVEESIDIIVRPQRNLASHPVGNRLSFRLRSPAQSRLVIVSADRSLSKTVLHIRFQENRLGCDTGIDRNTQPFILLSRLGRNKYHPVTGP